MYFKQKTWIKAMERRKGKYYKMYSLQNSVHANFGVKKNFRITSTCLPTKNSVSNRFFHWVFFLHVDISAFTNLMTCKPLIVKIINEQTRTRMNLHLNWTNDYVNFYSDVEQLTITVACSGKHVVRKQTSEKHFVSIFLKKNTIVIL